MRSLGQNPTEQEIQTWVILVNSPLFIYIFIDFKIDTDQRIW
jgi:hypothetical protein